jgi:hypothetical protein
MKTRPLQRRTAPAPSNATSSSILDVENRWASQSIWRSEQQLEQGSISLVSGGRSSAFRTAHDGLPFGGAYAPLPFSARLSQDHFKDWKSIRHANHDSSHGREELHPL